MAALAADWRKLISNHLGNLPKRILHFRRAFTRGIGRRLNTLEMLAVTNAAVLSAKAEAAALDDAVSPNDLVRLTNAAGRARLEVQTLFAKRDASKDLDQYIGVA
jgi:hypothetical protein